MALINFFANPESYTPEYYTTVLDAAAIGFLFSKALIAFLGQDVFKSGCLVCLEVQLVFFCHLTHLLFWFWFWLNYFNFVHNTCFKIKINNFIFLIFMHYKFSDSSFWYSLVFMS